MSSSTLYKVIAVMTLLGSVYFAANIFMPGLRIEIPTPQPAPSAVQDELTFADAAPAGPPFDFMIIVYVLVGIIVAYFVVIRGIFLIGDDQVGILTKKFGGHSMPPGQIIARRGEVGTQAKTLMPGLYWRFPLFWSVDKVAVIKIKAGELGIVESIDGLPLTKGRLLADNVDCNYFQDAEAFLDKGGMKGLQIAILPPGDYRINTVIFRVTIQKATKIESENLGIVTAQDGQPMPKEYMIAPVPLTAPTKEYPNARPHRSFQDGQAFIDSRGYRGTQLDTLQPGEYYINTHLFSIEIVQIADVPTGFVGILRSNVGPQSQQEPPVDADEPEKVDPEKQASMLLIEDKNTRGIWKTPIPPGKFNLNTSAYTMFLVPTSHITTDWSADTDGRVGNYVDTDDIVHKRPASSDKDRPSAPYLSQTRQTRALEFFRFSQLKVTSKDGFIMDVDVRMVIRIQPHEAAWIIARFGTVRNLIEQIVHPLIDSSFRNKAGEKKAIEFIQSRSSLQAEAYEKAKEEFKHHHVEAANLLINYINTDEKLLATQTEKEIALQQKEQFKEQALAEQERIVVQTNRARADKQPQVVAAQLAIEINKNQAEAAVEQAKGERESTKIKAEGQAQAIAQVGKAQADAYEAQARVMGPNNITLVEVMEKVKAGEIKITPDTLVMGGGGDGGNSGLLSAYFATMLPKPSQAPPADSNDKTQKKKDDAGQS